MSIKKQHGGARKNAGRKPVSDELQALEIIKKAIRVIYKKDNDDDAKIEFLKVFADSQRGQQFIAEHLFGKPKEIVENINYNYEQKELTEIEAKKLNKALEGEY